MKDGAGTAEKLDVAALFLIDAGDTFLPSHRVPEADRPRWEATALFLVERFGLHGLDALALGDRDLALGRPKLLELKKSARFPIIATNVVDSADGLHPFASFAVVEKAGVKVAFIGLMSEKRVTPIQDVLTRDGLNVRPPAMALADLRPQLEASGASVWVVLSQLLPAEEAELSRLFPQIRAFIGGDGMGMGQDPLAVGSAWSCGGGQKGKQIAVMKVDFGATSGPATPWQVGNRRELVQRRIEMARTRIDQYAKQLERLNQASPVAEPLPGASPGGSGSARLSEVRKKQVENQLAQARTELQVAETELADLPADAGAAANKLELMVFPMSREVPDDESEADAVKAFRKTWPAEPGH